MKSFILTRFRSAGSAELYAERLNFCVVYGNDVEVDNVPLCPCALRSLCEIDDAYGIVFTQGHREHGDTGCSDCACV